MAEVPALLRILQTMEIPVCVAVEGVAVSVLLLSQTILLVTSDPDAKSRHVSVQPDIDATNVVVIDKAPHTR